MKRGFSIAEFLVIISIIGILSAVVLASIHDARQKEGPRKTLQSRAIDACINQGGVPILSDFSGGTRLIDCLFNPNTP